MSLLEGWLEGVVSREPDALSSSFCLDTTEDRVITLQRELRMTDSIANWKIPKSDFPAMDSLVRDYLGWCKDVDPYHGAVRSFDLYAQVLSSLSAAWADPNDGDCLNKTVHGVIRRVLKIWRPWRETYEWLASCLLRFLQISRSEAKRSCLLTVASALCRVYFTLGQPSACGPVLDSVNTTAVPLSESYINEQVEYRYWLGRYCLFRGSAVEAFAHLDWVFNRCNNTSPNRIRVLHWLFVPSILVGRPPTHEVMEALNVAETLQPIITSIHAGTRDWEHVLSHPWICQRKLQPLLQTYMPLLVYRAVVRTLYHILDTPNELNLVDVQKALKLWGEPELDSDFVASEAICGSLISAGYLMANVFPKNLVLRLKRGGAMPTLLQCTKALDWNPPKSLQWLNR